MIIMFGQKSAGIALGTKVKDMITGLEGIVIGRTEYLTGCAHIAVQPEKLKDDGTIPDAQWFDETRAQVIDEKPVQLNPPAKKDSTGGPGSNAPLHW
jgi:hypothetical protein